MSFTLKLETIQQARDLHAKADPALKIIIESSLPEGTFSKDVYERIQTFESACFEVGEDPEKYKAVPGETDEERSDRFYQRLKIIHKAFRKALNWEPRLADSNQSKYWVWLTDFKTGSGFWDSGFARSRTHACVGSRLLLPDSKTALHVGKYFLSEFNGYQL
jgi:hypothetical protein